MAGQTRIALIAIIAFGCSLSARAVTSEDAHRSITVAIGDAVRLPFDVGDRDHPQVVCESRETSIAQAFNNGMCFGVSAGRTVAEMRARSEVAPRATCIVNVVISEPKLMAADSFQQFPDNRSFWGSHGRQCFGSELNCRQAETSGTRSNRVVNPIPPGTTTSQAVLWPTENDAPIVDGTGKLIGSIRPIDVNGRMIYATKINHGMTKIISGEVHVYAFSTPVILKQRPRSGEEEGVSAWIPLRTIKDKEALLERLHPGTGRLPALVLEDRSYLVTGGDPSWYTTDKGTPFSIVADVGSGPRPQHYLRREAGTINLLFCVPGFGLGGHNLDSFLLSQEVGFRPAAGVRKITVPTYYPVGHPEMGEVTPKTMTFVYGAIDVQGSPRVYGWMAEEALQKSQ